MTCLTGFVIGGLLGYFSWEGFWGFVFSDLNLNSIGVLVIVGFVYFLICMTLFMIATVYWLLTGKEDLGGGWL
jgi:hypothetical protein